MLDHDALSFSLVPFCYRVCPFVNQLHPLPSATSGIPGCCVHSLINILQHTPHVTLVMYQFFYFQSLKTLGEHSQRQKMLLTRRESQPCLSNAWLS
jgi:hypothetical protein